MFVATQYAREGNEHKDSLYEAYKACGSHNGTEPEYRYHTINDIEINAI